MVVALSQEPGFLRRNVVELDEHALDGHVAAVKLAGKHYRPVATGPELPVFIHFDAAHPENRPRDLLHICRHGVDVGLYLLRNIAYLYGLAYGIVNCAGRRIIPLRNGRFPLVLALPVSCAPSTTPVSFLLGRLF